MMPRVDCDSAQPAETRRSTPRRVRWGRPVEEYNPADFPADKFPAGSAVIDIGCGKGRYLKRLVAGGCQVSGVELRGEVVEALRQEGLDVRQGVAEQLPFDNESFDGVLCWDVLPYTDERRAISEWARVLKPGGQVRTLFHGPGRPLYVMLNAANGRELLFGLKGLVNGWLLWLLGRTFGGNLGRPIFQSRRRLKRFYRACGLELVEEQLGPRFAGLVMLGCHRLKKPEHMAD